MSPKSWENGSDERLERPGLKGKLYPDINHNKRKQNRRRKSRLFRRRRRKRIS